MTRQRERRDLWNDYSRCEILRFNCHADQMIEATSRAGY